MSYNLYRKDKTDYTFIIDNSMLEFKPKDPGPNEKSVVAGKIKLVCFKRDKQNKRIDMAEFYEDYKSFRAILDLLYAKWRNADAYKIPRFGGADGQRRLTWDLSQDKGPKLTLWFEDNISKEKFTKYTGKMMYSLNGALDFQELFNLRDTLNNWELLNLKELWAADDPEETTST